MTSVIGQTKGKLLVLSLDRKEDFLGKDGKTYNIRYYNCLCECGNTKVLRGSSLNSPNISCGCNKSLSNKSRKINLVGSVFNRLTVIAPEPDNQWFCICECGNDVIANAATLNSGNIKSCGCLQKDKASANITALLDEYRLSVGGIKGVPLSSDYKIKRALTIKLAEKIRTRDGNECIWCCSTQDLQVHHLAPWSVSEELRFDETNLVTLCAECHLSIHNRKFIGPVNSEMTILLSGYTKVFCARVELTPN